MPRQRRVEQQKRSPYVLGMIELVEPSEEGFVANKDKGSGKTDKKQSQKSLKEKRAAKKQKKSKSAPPSP